MELHLFNVEVENSDQEKKELYHSPKLEIIEVKVEKGFAASVGNGSSGNTDWGHDTW